MTFEFFVYFVFCVFCGPKLKVLTSRRKKTTIMELTFHAPDYLPHKPPMTMVDTLAVDNGSKYAIATIRPDNRFLNSDGVLDRTTLPEIVAQALAGYDSLENNGNIRPGVLAVMKNVVFHGDIFANDTIYIYADEERPMDNWCIVQFKIYKGNKTELISEGQLNLCLL